LVHGGSGYFIRGISWLPEELSAFPGAYCCLELIVCVCVCVCVMRNCVWYRYRCCCHEDVWSCGGKAYLTPALWCPPQFEHCNPRWKYVLIGLISHIFGRTWGAVAYWEQWVDLRVGRPRYRGSNPQRGQRFSLPNSPDVLWFPSSLPFHGDRVHLLCKWSGWEVKLTCRLHLGTAIQKEYGCT
jgi:hypothetical protein